MAISTREGAFLVWTALFLIWALKQPGVPSSLSGLIRTLLHWKLLMPILAILAYSASMTWFLYLIGFWVPVLLKDTITWVLFSGIVMTLSGLDITVDVPTWREVLLTQAKAIVLVEYVLNTYTFSFWIEFILVPVVTILVIVDAFSETRLEFQPLARITRPLLATTGIAILWFAMDIAISQFHSFSFRSALREILLPVVFSVGLVPLVRALSLLSAYEQLFLLLRVGRDKDRKVIKYARRRLIRHLGIRLTAVRAFVQRHRWELLRATTKADIDLLLKDEPRESPRAAKG